MAAPSNQHLLTSYPVDLQPLLTDALEIWEVTSQYLVAAGTDVEQLIADLYDGKYKTDPSIGQMIKGVAPVVSYAELAPMASPPFKPSNAYILTFPTDLVGQAQAGLEVWQVKTQYLIDKGTDVEQMLVDSSQGKFVDNTPAMSPNCKAIRPVSDVAKIA